MLRRVRTETSVGPSVTGEASNEWVLALQDDVSLDLRAELGSVRLPKLDVQTGVVGTTTVASSSRGQGVLLMP